MIKKGETVVAIGSPLGIKNTVSTGVLSGRLMEDSMYVLQFTAPISNGSSGGALFDNNGNVIGITYASYVDGQNLNLAIPVELANELYNNKGLAYEVSKIYIEVNPYMEQLKKYNHIYEVTISDLKNNPKEYDYNVVKIVAYISSLDYTIDDEDAEYDGMYIANKSNISLDWKHDLIQDLFNDFPDTPTVQCFIEDYTWIDTPIEAGQQVTVVGRFYYTAENKDGYLETDLIYHTD